MLRTKIGMHIGTAVIVACGLMTYGELVDAAESEVPEPFQGFDNDSKYTISYDDLTALLERMVVDVGLSNRQILPSARAVTGTRMRTKVKRYTEHEGNRFFYEGFRDNDAARQYLRDIQADLEGLPSRTPLAKFSRDEQLAYWLNLYNVTVLNQVIAMYPKRSLQGDLQGSDSIFSKKLLNVAGVPLSLDDIQYTILKQNYDDDPLILYGLYQGIVGGPNIRKAAYTGDEVYDALDENAYEFINSNRGTLQTSKGDFRVAHFYERNRSYFPDFDADLREHLLAYVEDGLERSQLQVASKLDPSVQDWTVTDLGGTDHEVAGSLSHNNAALLDAYRGPRRQNGSIMVATVIVHKPRESDKEPQRVDSIDAIEAIPLKVDGAQIEDVPEETEDMSE